jgi:FMN-binding protein
MTGWIRWTAPAAAVISVSAPAYAVQYLSVSDAQRAAFPSATFTEVQPGRVWKTSNGGVFVLDHVIGKHLYIDYAVSIVGGRVHRVDILAYRESYGGEVRSPSWLAQFVGKTSSSPLKVGADIRNISGATLSSMHVTEGVKRILDAYGHLR